MPAPAGVAVADVVLTALFDEEDADTVLGGVDGAATALRPGTVHVATDSLSPGLSERLGAEAAAAGCGYVAAPVFGRPDQLGSTAVLPVSGAAATVVRVWPLLAQLGRPWIVGERAPGRHTS